ncbi:metal-dependent hydrolase [Alkalihalobacillus sp. LMS39]|uniref:metal-dependent hydrolase n=1 Tax=Alkalihalobacillus sp. LMS39 TaxID=2924032 RepID=UPI001FB3641E|nr:metal-dependent hydrolase [Alkalihalobacillus sp. LMS39]UOE94984.1 metal-dependent hydrolase [Alkalihalobacillus sp. LMS39]
MDTGTHVVMGIAIGGLATLDPVIANDPVMKQSVMVAAIIGSQAPDFDTVLKLRNNATYIRNHRGITHSIPALLIWPFIIVGGIAMLTPEVNYLHLWLWTFLAVFLHVFVDIFNAYGTQALRPFSHRWVALGVINIFDPFIFLSHVVAIFIWGYGMAEPGITFLILYFILAFYYVWRISAKRKVVHHAKSLMPNATHVFVSPTMNYNKWHLVIRTPEKMQVAQSKNHEIHFFETYPFEPIPDDPVITAARVDKNLSAFLSFSPAYRWEKETLENGNLEVRFIDLRYRSKGHYPFVAIVQLNEDLQVMSSYTGWVFSEEKLQQKLSLATQ